MGGMIDKEADFEPEPEGAVGMDTVDITGGGAEGGGLVEGWLVKQGHLVKNWKRRYFVLEWPVLKYYKDPADAPAAARGQVLCDQVTLSEKLALERTGKEYCFGIFHPDRKTYFLQAESEADMMRWVKAIRNEKKVRASHCITSRLSIVPLRRACRCARLHAMPAFRAC